MTRHLGIAGAMEAAGVQTHTHFGLWASNIRTHAIFYPN